MNKTLWAIPALIFSLSMVLSAENYKVTQFEGDGYTLLSNGSAVGQSAGTSKDFWGYPHNIYFQVTPEGKKALEGFPELNAFSYYSDDEITQSGVILGDISEILTDNYFVYLPGKGYFSLAEAYKKSAYGSARGDDLDIDELKVSDQGMVAGILNEDDPDHSFQTNQKVFTFDPEKGFQVVEGFIDAELLAVNNHGDLLLQKYSHEDAVEYLIVKDGKVTELKDFGLKEYLTPFTQLDEEGEKNKVIVDPEEFTQVRLLDDGTIVGLVGEQFKEFFPTDYDETHSLFIRYPDGQLYISGITDIFEGKVTVKDVYGHTDEEESKDPALFYIRQFVVQGNDVVFVTDQSIFTIKKGEKAAHPVTFPEVYQISAVALIEGKVVALATVEDNGDTLDQILLLKEDGSVTKLIDQIEDKSLSDFEIDSEDMSINAKGDILIPGDGDNLLLNK